MGLSTRPGAVRIYDRLAKKNGWARRRRRNTAKAPQQTAPRSMTPAARHPPSPSHTTYTTLHSGVPPYTRIPTADSDTQPQPLLPLGVPDLPNCTERCCGAAAVAAAAAAARKGTLRMWGVAPALESSIVPGDVRVRLVWGRSEWP